MTRSVYDSMCFLTRCAHIESKNTSSQKTKLRNWIKRTKNDAFYDSMCFFGSMCTHRVKKHIESKIKVQKLDEMHKKTVFHIHRSHSPVTFIGHIHWSHSPVTFTCHIHRSHSP